MTAYERQLTRGENARVQEAIARDDQRLYLRWVLEQIKAEAEES